MYILLIKIVIAVLFTYLLPLSNASAITVEDYFRKPAISNASISPNGDRVVYDRFNNVMIGNSHIEFSTLLRVPNTYFISDFIWSGNDVLIVRMYRRTDGKHLYRSYKIKLNEQDNTFDIVRRAELEINGYIVDPITDKPDKILFAKYKSDDGHVYTDVYRVDLFNKKKNKYNKRNRINLRSDEIVYWLTDKSHRLVIGISYEQEIPSLWKRVGKARRLTKVWTAKSKVDFIPYSLSEDRKTLWAITNKDHDTKVAVEFDLEAYKIDKIIFELSGTDVSSIIMDEGLNKPLAISYFNKGQYEYKYIDQHAEQDFNTLQNKFPDQKLHIIDFSKDRNHQLVISTKASDPGSLSYCDIAKATCNAIGSLFPWFEEAYFSATEAIVTQVSENFSIESFITLPNSSEKASTPLIVMPHGGPIGVRDNSYFSGHTQWLASNGFAVLQVNYRGSGGYGKEFQFKGMQQWGRGIEDDIEAALEDTLAKYSELDKKRVCLFGSSYGGYSALMGIIRSPEKYRCAASFAGVTDMSLLFNKGSIKNDTFLTKSLKEIIGDPEKEMETLQKYSPVYQYEKISKPLMLIHGTEDEIVDIEHMWRLVQLLDLKDIPHHKVILNGVKHSFDTTDQIKSLYDNLLPFLNKHLSPISG